MYEELDLMLSWKSDEQRDFTNRAKNQGSLELLEFLQEGETVMKYLRTEAENSEQNDLLHSKDL